MAQQSTSDPTESITEQLVRTTLEAHVPGNVEVNRAWSAVAGRLVFTDGKAQAAAGPSLRPLRLTGRRPRRLAALVVIAVVLALPILLMGATLVRERFLALDPGMARIEDEHLYQDIGQRQEADGITVTITRAYADEGRTVFYYTIQMSPALAQRYTNMTIGSWSLTDQWGDEPSAAGVGTCTPWHSNDSIIDCYLIEGPLRPAPPADRLTITLDVLKVYLSPAHGYYDTFTGPWHFQFDLSYRHMNVGAVDQLFPHAFHLIPGVH